MDMRIYKTEEWYFQKLPILEVCKISDFQVYKNSCITLISVFLVLISFSIVLYHIYKSSTEITRCHVWAFLVTTYCGSMIIQRIKISVILKTRHRVSSDASKGRKEREGRLVKTDITHNPEKSSYKSRNNYSKFFLVHLNLPKTCGFFIFKAQMS